MNHFPIQTASFVLFWSSIIQVSLLPARFQRLWCCPSVQDGGRDSAVESRVHGIEHMSLEGKPLEAFAATGKQRDQKAKVRFGHHGNVGIWEREIGTGGMLVLERYESLCNYRVTSAPCKLNRDRHPRDLNLAKCPDI